MRTNMIMAKNIIVGLFWYSVYQASTRWQLKNVQVWICNGNVLIQTFFLIAKLCMTFRYLQVRYFQPKTKAWRFENIFHDWNECICAQSQFGHGTNECNTTFGTRDNQDSAFFCLCRMATISLKVVGMHGQYTTVVKRWFPKTTTVFYIRRGFSSRISVRGDGLLEESVLV